MVDRDSVYDELFQTYHVFLISFCVTQGIRAENAEDIASEAFTRALAKSDQFLKLEPKQQKSWLFSAVTNIIKENNAKPEAIPFSEIENIDNYIADHDDLEQLQSEETYQQYVQQVSDELSNDKERELFKLIIDEKLDYDTLSRKYALSSGTARVMVSRFRKKLREIVNNILID